MTNNYKCLAIPPRLLATLNQSTSTSTRKTPNEVIYGLRLRETLDFTTSDDYTPPLNNKALTVARDTIKTDDRNSTTFIDITRKGLDDLHHSEESADVGNMINRRLHRDDTLLAIRNRELQQQFVGLLPAKRRKGRHAYEFDTSWVWKTQSIIPVTQPEPARMQQQDPSNRPKPDPSGPVYIKNNVKYEKRLRKEPDGGRKDKQRGGSTVAMMRQWMDQGWHYHEPVQDLHNNLSDHSSRYLTGLIGCRRGRRLISAWADCYGYQVGQIGGGLTIGQRGPDRVNRARSRDKLICDKLISIGPIRPDHLIRDSNRNPLG